MKSIILFIKVHLTGFAVKGKILFNFDKMFIIFIKYDWWL